MNSTKRINKKPVVNVLVSSGNQTLASGALNTTGNSYNILSGQLGVLSATTTGTIAKDNFITAGTTASQVDKIRVVQGTPASVNFSLVDQFEVGHKAIVSSGTIAKDSLVSLTTKKLTAPNYSIQAFTTFNGTMVGAGKQFDAIISTLSVRRDRDYSRNTDVVAPSTTLPASLTGITNTLDYTLQRFLYNVNGYSQAAVYTNGSYKKGNKPFVALGIKAAGGSGQVLNTITSGTSIPFMTEFNPNTVTPFTSTLTADVALVKALGLLISAQAVITGTSTIEVIDLTTAGNAAKIDAFVIVGLAETTSAYFDDISQVMTNVKVNLGTNWRTSPLFAQTNIAPFEGSGKGRDWSIDNKGRAQLGVHTMQNHPVSAEFFSEGINYVDATKDYSSTIIEYFDYEDTLTLTVRDPKKLEILLPATTTTATTVAQAVTNIGAGNPAVPAPTTDSTTVTGLNNTLGAWLISAQAVNAFEVGGDATSSVYFA